MTDWSIHAAFGGPIVMIGFGSIGRGTLPLIPRHEDGCGVAIYLTRPGAAPIALVRAARLRQVRARVLPAGQEGNEP